MDNEQEQDISTIAFTDRERRLIDNCRSYAANDPAGLPGHNLMVIVAKLSNLLAGKELEEATERRCSRSWRRIGAASWAYVETVEAPAQTGRGSVIVTLANVWPELEDKEGWHYNTIDKDGVATTEQDAKACVEKALNG